MEPTSLLDSVYSCCSSASLEGPSHSCIFMNLFAINDLIRFVFALNLFQVVFLPPGESKRKTLPSWLREELEKVERQRQKKLEKEAKEAARREQSGRPTWRDELDEEEEMEEGRERHRVTRSYRYSRSKSPNKVCGVVCGGSR